MVLDLNSKSTLGPKVIVQIIKALACMQQEVTSNYMFQHMRSVGFHVSGIWKCPIRKGTCFTD